MTSHLDPRQILRRQLRQTRRNLSSQEQQSAALQLSSRFKEHADFHLTSGKRVALYLTNDGEISPHVLCADFWEQGIETYLPVVQGKHLTFARYSSETVWQENIFGIKEPVTMDYVSGEELDLVLLPLVGFDSKGGRLGMGGGFYDRTFANKKTTEKPRLIGLAHDCQEVKSLPVEGWDVPLEAIITPTKTLFI